MAENPSQIIEIMFSNPRAQKVDSDANYRKIISNVKIAMKKYVFFTVF